MTASRQKGKLPKSFSRQLPTDSCKMRLLSRHRVCFTLAPLPRYQAPELTYHPPSLAAVSSSSSAQRARTMSRTSYLQITRYMSLPPRHLILRALIIRSSISSNNSPTSALPSSPSSSHRLSPHLISTPASSTSNLQPSIAQSNPPELSGSTS